jgi:hypothetical protein
MSPRPDRRFGPAALPHAQRTVRGAAPITTTAQELKRSRLVTDAFVGDSDYVTRRRAT